MSLKNTVEVALAIHKHNLGYSVSLWIKQHIRWNQILMTQRRVFSHRFSNNDRSLGKILMSAVMVNYKNDDSVGIIGLIF
ncbi:hypothetical protein AF41_00397 [Citrobacter sp. MGH 55]|nr:hypothetical protein AF41_00397 [Citrobacter sp. MGH 55]KEY51958.1 hypothetical protein DQ02_21780 [Citrobacter amalonaticus]